MRASAVWCAVRRCATKASRSTRRLAVEVADVRRAVDGHGARDEVMMAPAEVVRPLVLRRRDRDDRLDGRGEPAIVRCGEERRSRPTITPSRRVAWMRARRRRQV